MKRIIDKVREKKLTYLERQALIDLLFEVKKCNDLEGIFIETGCALGGSAICIADMKADNKQLNVYDVFGLIPEPSEKDGQDVHERYEDILNGKSVGIDGDTYYGYVKDLKTVVENNFKSVLNISSLSEKNINLIQGLFEESLYVENKVALAHIDCDWYDSVMTCLERIVPKLVPGGVLIIDDYNAWSGCKAAVDDYFQDKKGDFDFIEKSRLHVRRKAGVVRDNAIMIDRVSCVRNRIEVEYEVTGNWKKYFTGEKFFCEYNEDITGVSESINVLPFIGNIIVLASICNAQIYLNEVDKAFYESFPLFIKGYQQQYPSMKFYMDDVICPNAIVDNSLHEKNLEQSICFFSGGVDACYTAIDNIQSHPTLLTVWGADVDVNADDSWQVMYDNARGVADTLCLPITYVKSSFRKILDEVELSKIPETKGNWWHAIHHSVARMTLTAPYLELKRIGTVFFSATYTYEELKHGYQIASVPAIDNYVRMLGASVVHWGADTDRYDKVIHICNYSSQIGKKINLHVCFQNDNGGENCSSCEKCVRTMIPMVLEGYSPENYGFQYDKEEFPEKVVAAMKALFDEVGEQAIAIYREPHRRFREKYDLPSIPKCLRAVYMLELEDLYHFYTTRNFSDDLYKKNKAWLDELQKQKQQLEADYVALQDWCRELQTGKNWLEAQKEEHEKYIQSLIEGNEWLKKKLDEANRIINESLMEAEGEYKQ